MCEFYIKGTILVTSLPLRTDLYSKMTCETYDEEFFHKGFTKSGYSLSQGDVDIRLDYDLLRNLEPSEFNLEPGKCYTVLWGFNLHHHQDYWGEWDTDIETVALKIQQITNEDYITYLTGYVVYDNQGVLDYLSDKTDNINLLSKTHEFIDSIRAELPRRNIKL